MNCNMAEIKKRDLYQWWRSQHSFVYWWFNPIKSKQFNDINNNFQKTRSVSQNHGGPVDFFLFNKIDFSNQEAVKTSLSNLTNEASSFLESRFRKTMRVMFRIERSRRVLDNYQAIKNILCSLLQDGYALDRVVDLYLQLGELCFQEESSYQKMKADMGREKVNLEQSIKKYYYLPTLFNPIIQKNESVVKKLSSYFIVDRPLLKKLNETVQYFDSILDKSKEYFNKLTGQGFAEKIDLVKTLSSIRKDWRQQSCRTFFIRTSDTRGLDHALDTLIQSLMISTTKKYQHTLSVNLLGLLSKIDDWKGKRKKKTGFFDINFFSRFSSQGKKTSSRYDDVVTLDTKLCKLKHKLA